jgi:nicotinate-nucleotide pyrophosphorylase (carboxylating)
MIDPLPHRNLLRQFLLEDVGDGDITTQATVPADRKGIGTFIAKSRLVLAGIPVALEVFKLLDEKSEPEILHADGDVLDVGEAAARVRSSARALLTGERVALNLLQRMSGIATLTRRFVDAVAASGVEILDTRKTTPGLRALEKYAVTVGGGRNHRLDLGDAILIKENHIRMAGGVRASIAAARSAAPPGKRLEAEVTSVEELKEALECDVDAILLDNMQPDEVRRAVTVVRARERGKKILVEASGGVTLANVEEFAAAGVDWISVGALTHSAPAVDISFEIEPMEASQ